MKKLLLVLLSLAMHLDSLSFHIVGGEIELIHVGGYVYNINLIQYFDAAQTTNPGPEQSAIVSIFKNGSSTPIRQVTLFLQDQRVVPYTTPECAIGELVTRRPFYTGQVTLNPALYSDPAGYYIVWERCCRNAAVANINNANGTSVGMTYVLDFPPVTKNGEQFINSSPSLLPPLSDYACVGQLYYADFSGTDFDGDSLVYSLTTPLNSSTNEAVPTPSAKPHFGVQFSSGFDVENMVPGNPSLQISNEGLLTVEPLFTGLFVFSVLVEEFRNGEKIGQLTRDFQMLVIDGCDPPAPPDAIVQVPGDREFRAEVDTIKFTVADEKCFDFLVTDNVGDLVTFRAEGVNFEQEVEDIFSFNQAFINNAQDTLKVEVCIPDCPYVRDEPFIIDLLAADNACPLPQIDTVRLTIFVEPPPNESPYFGTANKTRIITIPEDDMYSESFVGFDDDNDFLETSLVPVNFNPAQFGMALDLIKNEAGENEVFFEWDAQCLTYDFEQKSNFEFYMVLEDLDVCMVPVGDSIYFNLTVELPPNNKPTVSTDLNNNAAQVFIDGSANFTVTAEDIDNDEIVLSMYTPDFNSQALGLGFDDKTGVGQVSGDVDWPLACETLGIENSRNYPVYFIVEDNDKCKISNADTLKVDVNVIVPFNNKPEFDEYPDYELVVNEPFELVIRAEDLLDITDSITMDFLAGIPLPESESLEFGPASGVGEVIDTLKWTPECSLLGDNFSPARYNLAFLAWDDKCPTQKFDTMFIAFELRELDVTYDTFLPANVFTPNGDNRNDTFKLTDLPLPEQNLPPDNCEDQFLSITIVDRKGKTVFFSEDRNFEWTGEGYPASTYYYNINYMNNDYKGSVSILY